MKSKLILGTVQLGLNYGINNSRGKPSRRQSYAILDYAVNKGIGYLDTAAAYGDSEKIIGGFHRDNGSTAFQIITKFHDSGKPFSQVVSDATDRLGVDQIDTLLFHSFSDYQNCRDQPLYDELLAEQGKTIGKLGVSVYTNEELEEIAKDDTVSVLQLPFNLLDNEKIRGSHLKSLSEKGKVIHTRSVFLQGLFFMNPKELPDKLTLLAPYLEKLQNIAEEAKIPLGALALQYVLNKPYISGVLFGVETLEQLKLNLRWLTIEVDPKIYTQIDDINVRQRELLQPTNW
ncbi:MAG: aldo/keto reductase [Roseivirga sp.]|uniref:aldo/keto reductase n=1 Tax=Roseivirga sp. TaxID=1964215 RepID=UPI001B0AAA82|nr:aldo/keto reductase [Roseivirga sp.]MBO6660487.1 aldo/keto reductase [Roseivirga sp.]MBO6760770.1 aldo/keto reductase [Roseivirga sp.]MBO6906776.1 aldo/keto reductase [Roseivirga sp.]